MHNFSSEAFILSKDGLVDPNTEYDWNEKIVGMFYIKPNYPGRCSHVSKKAYFFCATNKKNSGI